jgi:hypothetical protein
MVVTKIKTLENHTQKHFWLKISILGDPDLSRSLSKLTAFGHLCRSTYKIGILMKY